MLIFSSIYENANKTPNKICMTLGDIHITYTELVQAVDKRAAFLVNNFKIGEKIIIQCSNPIDIMINFLACAKAGLICLVVSHKTLPITFNKIRDKIKPNCVIDDNFNLKLEKCQDTCNLPIIKDNSIFLLILSSGTTGHNKIILRDHKSWMDALKYHGKVFNINFSDTLFLVGSLSYSANLYSTVHMLNEGGTIVFSRHISPKAWIKEMNLNNVTTIFMVPAHYRLLLKETSKTMPNINSTLSCGDKLDAKTIDGLKIKFPKAHIYEYYGASELGIVSFMDFRKSSKTSSVGTAFPGVELKIKDSFLWVKSPYLAPDFAPQATVYDIAKIDSMGNLYILGRKNDTINKGGIKILPYNIEKIIDKHPNVLKSIVFGVNDSMKGKEIAAIIIPKNNDLTIKDIREYCKNNLETCCRPKKIKIVQEVNLNLNGKIDRKSLISNAVNYL
ncbi:MAG: AMP-binding protein [Clostridium sp.]|nr:AMP-binding protein [Clostridium sp.]